MIKNISLEQSLQAYRVMSTPTQLSWKQHWANEVFTNDPNQYFQLSNVEYSKEDILRNITL